MRVPAFFLYPKDNVAGMCGGIICVSHNDTRATTRRAARDAEETHIMRLYNPTGRPFANPYAPAATVAKPPGFHYLWQERQTFTDMRNRTARQNRWREYTIDDLDDHEIDTRPDDGQDDGGGLSCPRCGSRRLQAVTRGFHFGRAAGCGCLTGSWLVALLAGALGARRTEFVCLDCGRRSQLDKGCGRGGCCAVILIAAIAALLVTALLL